MLEIHLFSYKHSQREGFQKSRKIGKETWRTLEGKRKLKMDTWKEKEKEKKIILILLMKQIKSNEGKLKPE